MNKFKLIFLIFFCSFIYSYKINAQHIIPLNQEFFILFEKEITQIQKEAHTSFKPLTGTYISRFTNTDSLVLINRTNKPKSLFLRKLRYENLIAVDSNDFHLTIDPLFNFEVSKQKSNSEFLYSNTRGFWAQGSIGKKFSFESGFYENQSAFNTDVKDKILSSRVVPGQGSPKGFEKKGYDYASATGLISFTPNEHFNFQFGHGKNFIGDGYRSLFLSDNSFNYPFLKITTTIWKLQYTNLFASFLNLNVPHAYEQGFQKKFGTFHYLSWNIHKRVQIGLFETIIWQNYQDSTGYKRGFDYNYLNPIIFYRPIEYSLSSPDNALIGFSSKIKITDKFYLYGQFILDDLDVAGMKKGKGYILEKYGIQGGFKAFDLFKCNNLFFQSELNMVQPYVYAHKSPGQNYSHYNQALAHPLGANFIESVSILRYRFKDFYVEYKLNYALYGGDDTLNSHWGHNIFISDFNAQRGFPSWGNKILQGVKTTLIINDFRVSYVVNPKTNFNISLGVTNRIEKSAITDKNNMYVYFGIRTSLTNLYYDY